MQRVYVEGMKQSLLIASTALCLALPATAQEEGEGENGLSLMERGAQMFMEGIMREMEPALDDLRGMAEEMQPALRRFVDEMGPAFAELLGQIEDLSLYHPPEMLPNGDIIIRRKTPDEIEQQNEGDDIEI